VHGTFVFYGLNDNLLELVGTDGSYGELPGDGVIGPTDDGAIMLVSNSVYIRVPVHPVDVDAQTSRTIEPFAGMPFSGLFRDGLLAYRGNDPAAQEDVWWIGFDGTDVALATTTSAEFVYTRREDVVVVVRNGDIVGTSIDGSAPWSLASSGDVEYPVLLTPGNRVIYLREGGGSATVRSVALEGGSDVLLTTDSAPAYEATGVANDRVVIEVDGNQFGAFGILSVGADGSNPVTLAGPGFGYRTTDVNRCFLGVPSAVDSLLVVGDRLFYLELVGDAAVDPRPFVLHSVPLDGGPSTNLGFVSVNGERCSVGEDIIMSREAGAEIERLDPVTGESVTLAPAAAYAIGLIGDRLVIQLQADGAIYSVRAEDGGDSVRLLPDGGPYVYFYGASEDDALMLGCDDTANNCDVFKVDLLSGAERQLAESVIVGSIFMEDGWLVHSVQGEDELGSDTRIFAVAIDGGGTLDITPPVEDLPQYHAYFGFFR